MICYNKIYPPAPVWQRGSLYFCQIWEHCTHRSFIWEGVSAMIHGVVDLGSNTVRLSIYQCEEGSARLLMNRKVTAGLADYVEGGTMTPRAFRLHAKS